jgi:hypothetical protein
MPFLYEVGRSWKTHQDIREFIIKKDIINFRGFPHTLAVLALLFLLS